MMKRIALSLAALIFSLGTYARDGGGGVTAGGGGGGVEIDGMIYLTDLYLAGIHNRPYFANVYNISVDRDLAESEGLDVFPKQVLRLVSIKLSDIEKVDAVFSSALYEAMLMLDWSFVTDRLLKTEDMDNLPIVQPVTPIAVRQGQSVYIERAKWNKMNDENRAALLIHEASAALAPNRLPADVVRRMVAHLFKSSFFFGLDEHKRQEILRYWPSYKNASVMMMGQNSTFVRRFTHAGISLVSGTADQVYVRRMGTTILSPQIQIGWRDSRSRLTQMITGGKDSDSVTQSAIDPKMALARLCNAKATGAQAISTAVTYVIVRLYPADVDEDGVHPTLRWAVERRTMVSMGFLDKFQGTKATCSAKNLTLLSLLDQWAASISSY